MMSVFSRAGAGIQNILSEWRQPAKLLPSSLRDATSLMEGGFYVSIGQKGSLLEGAGTPQA